MGWFANMLFGTPKPVEPPKPPQSSIWGVSDEEVPNIAEQKVDKPAPDVTPPEVLVTRVEPKISGDCQHLEVWVCLENNFESDLEVVRFECLGQKTSMARYLKPGETHEVRVYSGDMPKNDAEHTATSSYKSIASGDYYDANYHIKYRCSHHENMEYFVPYQFDLQRPVA